MIMFVAMSLAAASMHASADDCPPPCQAPNPDYDPNDPYETDPPCNLLNGPIDGEPCKECKDGEVEDKYPGPKPDGCYKLNEDCEWAEYEPDCKAEEDHLGLLQLQMQSLALKIGLKSLELEKMIRRCDCAKYPDACIALPADSVVPPDDPCAEVEKLQKELDELNKKADRLAKEIEAAAKALDDCKNCRS